MDKNEVSSARVIATVLDSFTVVSKFRNIMISPMSIPSLPVVVGDSHGVRFISLPFNVSIVAELQKFYSEQDILQVFVYVHQVLHPLEVFKITPAPMNCHYDDISN